MTILKSHKLKICLLAGAATLMSSSAASAITGSQEAEANPSYPEFNIFGRVQLDGWSNENTPDTDFGDRRLRLGVATRFSASTDFVVDLDFANGEVVPQDVRLAHRFTPRTQIQIGHIKVPSSLDERTDDLVSAFIERAAFSQLSPAYALGGMVSYEAEDWSVGAGVFQRAQNGSKSYEFDGDGWQLGLRGGRLFTTSETGWIYLGAAAHRVENGDDTSWTSSVSSENGGSNAVTLVLANPEQEDFIGLEFASHFNGVVVQAEVGEQQFDTASGSEAEVTGGYVELSWLPGGATRTFNIANGTMGGFEADQADFSFTGGQVQLGVRLSQIDVDDDTAGSAELTTLTAGVNYHMGANVRVMLNYIDTEVTGFNTVAQDDASWGVRLQKFW